MTGVESVQLSPSRRNPQMSIWLPLSVICVRCARSGFCTDVPLPGGGTPRRDGKMDCGEGVPLCGVLTLETGYGGGYYHHAHPSVHGLWPQVGEYGSSACIPPRVSAASPTRLYPCYAAPAAERAHQAPAL